MTLTQEDGIATLKGVWIGENRSTRKTDGASVTPDDGGVFRRLAGTWRGRFHAMTPSNGWSNTTSVTLVIDADRKAVFTLDGGRAWTSDITLDEGNPVIGFYRGLRVLTFSNDDGTPLLTARYEKRVEQWDRVHSVSLSKQ